MENSHSSRPCKCPLTSLAAPDSGSQTNASKELPWYPGTHQSTSQAPMSSQCLPYPSVSPSQMASALQREMCPGELQWTPAGKCLPCVSLRGTPCDWLPHSVSVSLENPNTGGVQGRSCRAWQVIHCKGCGFFLSKRGSHCRV